MKNLLLAAVLLLPIASKAQEEPAATGSAPVSESERPTLDGEPIAAPEAPPAAELGTVPVANPAEAAPPPEAGRAQLDEIVVTAQKVKQPLRKVPVSVSAFDGDAIRNSGAVTLSDLSLYIPNVRVDAHDLGSPQIFIRGFGTNAFNPSFEGSVAFVQDELYFGRPGYFTEALFDVDRVEVLRGSQGTLFGKNTVAGVFNVSSRGPDKDLGGEVQCFGGSYAERRCEGGADAFFGDWGGARLSFLARKENGHLRNQLLGRSEEEVDQKAGRLKLHLLPLDTLTTDLTLVRSETDAPFWPYQLKKLDDDTRSYLQGFDPEVEDDPTDFVTSFDTEGWINKGSTTGILNTRWDIGTLGPLADLESVLVLGPSKFHIDQLNELDVSPADIARLDSHEDHSQNSVELRFSGRAGSLFGLGTGLEFVGGAFYFASDYTLFARVLSGKDLGSYTGTRDFCQLATGDPQAQPGSGPCTASAPGTPGLGGAITPATNDDWYQFDYDQAIKSAALFGQATWYLSERWALTPGIRFNRESKDVNSAGASHCPGKDAGQPCFMESLLMANDYDDRGLTRDETDVSPKLALQYFATGDIGLYASYAQGYKSGGFNAISFTGNQPADPAQGTPAISTEYEPEKARTAEVGIKGWYFDRTLSVNLTGYQTDFDDLQVLAFSGLFFTVSNAGRARSRGLEADFIWLTPYEPLKVIGSASMLDARYLAYPDAPAPISEGINQTQDLAGQRMAFAPRNSATLTPMLTYFPFGLQTTFAVDILHQGDQYTDVDLDPEVHLDAYNKIAARILVTQPGAFWTVSVGGTNLTDERVVSQVTDAPFFPGTYFAHQAAGRAVFGSFTLNFGS